MSYIIKVKTENCSNIKTLFEVLKGIIPDCTLEFISNGSSDDKKDDYLSDIKREKKEKKEKKHKTKIVKHKKTDKSKSSIESKQKGGIRIYEIGGNETVIVTIFLDADQFAEFYVKYPVHEVGINLTQLYNYIGTIKDTGNILTISINEDSYDKIAFTTENKSKKSSTKYEQSTLNRNSTGSSKSIKPKFDIVVSMNTAEFHAICKDCRKFSTLMEILCTPKHISFRCTDISCSYSKTFGNSTSDDDTIGVSIKVPDTDKSNRKDLIVEGVFDLDQLTLFSKCTALCKNIELFLANNYPLFIHYSVASLGKMIVGISPVDPNMIKTYEKKLENGELIDNDTIY